MSDLARILEALLFLSSDPLSTADLAEAAGAEPGAVGEALADLAVDGATAYDLGLFDPERALPA